jgi:hypothetical protein
MNDTDTAAARRAAHEAQRLIDRARGKESDPLYPLPLFSRESARLVFIRFDDERKPRLSAAAYAMMIIALALLVGMLRWAFTL